MGRSKVITDPTFDSFHRRGLTKDTLFKLLILPLLVFGGICRKTGTELQDSFNRAFSIASNLSAWKKCGAAPLTRLPLSSKEVRREIPVGAAAAMVEEEADDPELAQLKRLESLNQFHCDVLSSHGFDGKLLSKKAPTRSTYVAVTQPQTKERILAIKKAKTAGQMFFATGGRHVNSNEFFQAQEAKLRDVEIAKMEKAKEERQAHCKDQRGAVLLLKKKGKLTSKTEKIFTLPEIKILLKWKKAKAISARKRDMVDAYLDAPKPKIQKVWCRSEEAALQALREDVKIEDTALGVASNQMARAVGNNLASIDMGTRATLKAALETFEDSHNPNAL